MLIRESQLRVLVRSMLLENNEIPEEEEFGASINGCKSTNMT